jgi:DNA repair exonuclease SbcCD ATPase subunit
MNANVQKVLDLEKQFQEAKQVAIQDLLKQRQTIDEQLKVLGHDNTKKAPVVRQTDPNKKCPVCGETGHDARRHKNDPKPPAEAPPKPEAKAPATPPKPEKK